MDIIEPDARVRILAAEIANSTEAGLNTLGLILNKLDLPPGARVLDIGGIDHAGLESTRFIASRFTGQIDIIQSQTQNNDEFVKTYGNRVKLLDKLPAANAPPYDLVVASPKLNRAFADLKHFAITRSQLVARGGFLVAYGLRPESVGSDAFLQPPEAVVKEFKNSFNFLDSYPPLLPRYLSSFRWFGQFPRKTRSRSFLAWYVFQKIDGPVPELVAGATVRGNVSLPVPPATKLVPLAAKPVPPAASLASPVAKPVSPAAKPVSAAVNPVSPAARLGPPAAKVVPVSKSPIFEETRAGTKSAQRGTPVPATPVSTEPALAPAKLEKVGPSVSSLGAVASDRESVEAMAGMLARVHRFGPPEYKSVTDAIEFIAPPPEVMEVLAEQPFDTFMFVNNAFEGDARVMKTAEAVHGFGRRLVAVGLSKGTSYEIRRPDAGFPLILVPNHVSMVSKGLKKNGFPLDVGPRYEIWMAVASVYLATLLMRLPNKPPAIVLHSHDFMGAYAGGSAVRLATASASMSSTSLKWIHDVHEFVQRYDIIDPTLQKIGCQWEEEFYQQADALSTVSGTLADNLMRYYRLPARPSIVYNSNRLSVRHKYKGPSCREYVGCGDAPLLVHSGSIRPGRGVEYAIEALTRVDAAHLLLLTGSDTPYLATLLEQAEIAGVRARIHLHPLLPYDEVAGFIAEATAGLIPMEHYGNADVALPNKLFDYINAEVPVISADTDNIRSLMAEWKIGRIFPAKDVDALVTAIRDVIANCRSFKAEIRARPDLVLSCAWETQVMKLFDIYKRLKMAAHSPYAMELPQY